MNAKPDDLAVLHGKICNLAAEESNLLTIGLDALGIGDIERAEATITRVIGNLDRARADQLREIRK